MFPWFREFLTAFGADVVAKKLLPDLVVPALIKKFTEYRDEFFAFLRSLAEAKNGEDGARASANLFRRWSARQHCARRTYGNRAPYEAGDEGTFEGVLGRLFKHLDQAQEERDTRREIFIWLGNLPDREFDEILPILQSDRVLQYFTRYWNRLARAVEGILVALTAFVDNSRPSDGLRDSFAEMLRREGYSEEVVRRSSGR